jgi:hypothetical protein
MHTIDATAGAWVVVRAGGEAGDPFSSRRRGLLSASITGRTLDWMSPAPTPFHPRFPIGMQFALMNQSRHQFRVQPVAQGAAVAVVPVGESITAEPLRESLTETIQRSLPASRASIDIKFFAIPCEVGSFVGVVVGGFADSPEAGSISALIVFLILALLQYTEQS